MLNIFVKGCNGEDEDYLLILVFDHFFLLEGSMP